MMAGELMPRRLPRYCIEDVDRYGNVRVYLRRKGSPKIKLTGTPWTAEFMAAYHAALGQHSRPTQGPQPQTWEWLCRLYFQANVFTKKLTPTVQGVRRRILARTFDEPIAPGAKERFGDMPLSAMTPKAIRVLRDRAANNVKDEPTPEAANSRLKAIRQVFLFGIEDEHTTTNPARDVAYIHQQTDGFYTWTREDVLQYLERHPLGTKAHLVMSLLLYTGARRSDVVLLGKQHIRHGKLKFKPKKTRTTTGKDLDLPALPELQCAIDAGPTGDLTFIVTESGKPYSVKGFGAWFKRRCKEAGLPQCSAHGLRKAGASFAAENGATDAELMAMFGWESPKMAALYRKKARQKTLANNGMELISPTFSPGVSNSKKTPIAL